MPSNAATANVVHHDLDLHCQIKNCEMWISRKRWELEKKMLKYEFYKGWHLPSNGAFMNDILCDLDLHFQGQKCETLISRKWWELSQKRVIRLFPRLRFDIERHFCECFTSWPWPSFSRAYFLVMHLLYTNCASSGCPRQICLYKHGPRRGVSLIYFCQKHQ